MIGLLFLGGGNYSLRRDPMSAACLLLSLLPKYPIRTVEQQFHLQAARHLYVLAAEPRALHTVDVDSGETVSVEVDVTLVSGKVIRMAAPGLLPELASIRTVSVAAPLEGSGEESRQDGPPPVRYHATTLVLNDSGSENAEQQRANEDLCATARTRALRLRYRQAAVPPLFVKRISSRAPLMGEGTPRTVHPVAELLAHMPRRGSLTGARTASASEETSSDGLVTVAVVNCPLFAPILLNALKLQ